MTWQTSYDEWVAWLSEEVAGRLAGPLDALDAELCARLEQARFPSSEEETVVSSPGNGAAAHADDDPEERITVVPTHAPQASPAAASAGQLEVALASPAAEPYDSGGAAGQLEVALEAPGAEGLYIPALTRSGATPPGGIEVMRGQTVVAPAPPPPAVVADPTPRPVSPSEATPPEPTFVSSTPSPVPSPSDSGELGADQSAASSQTAGEIVMLDDELEEFDPGSSMSGGKIVINTSVHDAILDEEEDEEDEPDELDASDLVEEPEPPRRPPQPAELPPTPPPARVEARRETPRSSEPSLATRAALAELQAEAGLGAGTRGGPRSWFEEVFDDHYAALIRPGSKETAEAEVRFFVETAGLEPGAHVLDMGCGHGDHALALAKRGFAVTGVDLSLSQLLRASQAKDAVGAQIAFLQGDMRDPPTQGPFEGVLCVGSTIGYFSDEENLECLRRMHDMLMPGGKLLLEVFNRDHIISRLPARSWWQGRACLVLDEAEMDYFANRLLVHRTVVFEDGRQFEHRINMRAYAVHELALMCRSVGLAVVEVSGSRCTRGRFFGASSPDIWLLAERPAR
jgi:SAM-dependent methyltransferase